VSKLERDDRSFTVLVPLSEFNWDGEDFSFSSFGSVNRSRTPLDLSWCESFLSQDDRNEVASVAHWLSFEQSPKDPLNQKEKLNLFLLALWLVVPTKTHAKFRFEVPREAGEGVTSGASRLLDRFRWIRTQVKDKVETKHLQQMSSYIDAMTAIYTARKRLRNSLVLTLRGCMATDWQVAIVCFSAAAEGLLTHKKGSGLTNRLSKSYACLVETTKHQRDRAFETFRHSYDVRADIMHGRATHRRAPKRNLREAGRFSDMLRRLWKAILASNMVWRKLENDDATRRIWFGNLEKGYVPPR
jgi:hypothetical protein